MYLELVEPCLDKLPAYAAALKAGWSPNTTRDVTEEQLGLINEDPQDFIDSLVEHEGRLVTAADGTKVPRLPGRVFWMWDGEFCGAINLRFVPGTLDLPPHVSGHVGYAVVPWKRDLGYATRALALVLPIAYELGLPRLLITCNESNMASRRVIESNGGMFSGSILEYYHADQTNLLFWIDLPRDLSAQPSRFA